MNKKVLVIDDEPDMGKLIDVILKPLGISVYIAHSGTDGLKLAYMIHPDLVILDISMPGLDGFDVCARLREVSTMSIMMLSARIHENDVLRSFNVGANDYLKKPFVRSEFEARVLALLKRSNANNADDTSYISHYVDPFLEINLSAKAVKLKGQFVNFSPREYELLECLVRRQGKVTSQRELVREAWGDLSINDLSELSLYIYYLRKKLNDGQDGHQYIRTFWGRGYWFEPRQMDEKNNAGPINTNGD
jgi:DNA-binding response OmpR family regulator